MSIGNREDELYDTFQTIIAEELPHVCVGGLAVSAFLPRATLDIDIVAPAAAHAEYRTLLSDLDYEFTKEYESEGMYHGRMVQYQKAVGSNTVEVELLLDALGCRQTGAEWGYDHLFSIHVDIQSEARVPIMSSRRESQNRNYWSLSNSTAGDHRTRGMRSRLQPRLIFRVSLCISTGGTLTCSKRALIACLRRFTASNSTTRSRVYSASKRCLTNTSTKSLTFSNVSEKDSNARHCTGRSQSHPHSLTESLPKTIVDNPPPTVITWHGITPKYLG
jgi:hypothetical protein